MDALIFLVLVLLLIFMILQNYRLFKRSKHVKTYVNCSDAIFADRELMLEIIDEYVKNENDEEFKNKGRILQIYALMAKGQDPLKVISELDLKETILNNKGKFDAKQFEYNSDSYFWMILDIIKAHSIDNKEAIDGLVSVMDKYYEYINQDVVVGLFYNVHHALSHDSESNSMYLRDLWNGNYQGNPTYDKRLIGFYKYIAVSVLAYLGENLSEEMVQDLKNFAGMKAGRLAMRDLGILERFDEPVIQDEPDEGKPSEDVKENKEALKEEKDEDQ